MLILKLSAHLLPILLSSMVAVASAGVQGASSSSPGAHFAELSDAVQARSSVKRGAADDGGLCGESNWSSGIYSLERDGLSRDFRVFVPESYNPSEPAPLIVAFHGWGGGNGEFLDKGVVSTELEARGYVLVAPVGLGPEEARRSPASWSFSGSTTGLDGDGLNLAINGDTEAICDDARTTNYDYSSCSDVAQNGCSWTQCTDDDVDYAVALAKAAAENLCIDSGRVFAVGGSNGGMFTWDLGRTALSAQMFRAIAPIIGLPHRGYLDPPVKSGGMPALLITGKQDRTVPPGEWSDRGFTTTTDGDVFYYTGASAIAEVWAEASDCDVSQPPTAIDVGVANVECRAWSGCSGGGRWPPVLDCRSDMGHVYGLNWSWPLIMDFFDQYK